MAIFPNVRDWWRALSTHRLLALLIILAVFGTAISSGEGVDLAALESGLPDSRRLIRAVVFIIIFAIASSSIITNPLRFKLAGTSTQLVLLYSLLATLSAIYSIHMIISLWKGFEILTFTVLAISIAGHLHSSRDIRWLYSISSLIVLYLILTVISGVILYPDEALRNIDPNSGVQYVATRGLVPIMNPATQGVLAAFLVISSLVPILTREKAKQHYKLGSIVILCIAIFLLLMARSRTQMFACTISIVCLLIFGRRLGWAILVGFIGMITIILNSESVLRFIYRGQTEEQFASATGRFDHWERVMGSVFESPLIGKGFYATQKLLYGSGSVDNSYLEVLVGLGFLGLIIFVMPVFITSIAILKTKPKGTVFSSENTLWLQIVGFFTIIIIRSITSPGLATMGIIFLFSLFAHISISSLYRLQKNQNTYSGNTDIASDPEELNKNLIAAEPLRILQKRQAHIKRISK